MFGRALSGRFLRSFSAVFQKYNIVLKEVVVRTLEIGSRVYLFFWGGKIWREFMLGMSSNTIFADYEA